MKITHYFDVCGTLYTVNTTFDFIKFYHKKHKNYFRLFFCFLLGSAIGKVLHRYFRISTRDYFIRTLKGIHYSNLTNTAKDYFESELLKSKKLLTVYSIFSDYLNNNSCNVVLISASIDPVISVIAEYYSVDFYCTELEYIDNVCSGKIKLDLKGRKMSCIKNSKGNSTFYSDNLDDLICASFVSRYYFIQKKKNIKLEKYHNVEIINI